MQIHHTLLPNEERKILYKDYRFRVLTVASLTFSSVILIGIVFLVPAFLEAYNFKHAELSLVNSVNTKVNPNTQVIKDELIKDNMLLNISKNYRNESVFSSLMREVIGERQNISISSISIEPISSTSTNIVVQGIAPTRDGLLNLKNRLSKLEKVNSVELPLSGLTKSEQVPFSLRINRNLP